MPATAITLAAALAVACSSTPAAPPPPSLATFLPALPPTGGVPLALAGLVTEANRASELPSGDGAKGLPGDFFMRNDKIRVLIQAPGRFAEILGFGGNPVNLAFVGTPGSPGTSQFGELSAFLNGSHTPNFTKVEVVRDGKAGGPAVIRATGYAAILDYFNLSGFVDGLGLMTFDALTPPPVDVAATYILTPGEKHLRIVYTLFNRSDAELPIAIGTFCDSGGEVSFFTPGIGFGEAKTQDLAGLFAAALTIDYWAGQSPDSAYGVLPAPAGSVAPTGNTALFLKGQGVMLHDASSLLSGLTSSKVKLAPKGGTSYEAYLFMGEDIGDVHTQVINLRKAASGSVAGFVRQGAGAGAPPLAGARVAVHDAAGAVVTVFTSRPDGSFGGALAPGSYTLAADAVGWPRSDEVPFTIAAGQSTNVSAIVAPTATVTYTVVDGQDRPLAAHFTFVGEGAGANANAKHFRDVSTDGLGPGMARVAYTWRGSSAQDGAISIRPGEYRVFVSHGPEYTAYDQRHTLAAGTTTDLAIKLHKVVDSAGYIKGDFHQHGVNSPDANTPMRQRVITYLAADVEYVGSSDHDYLTDYGPMVASMGMSDKLATMVGVESTPFDYGHYNAFPLPIDRADPSQGAPDWGDGERTNLSPGRLFAKFRSLGAEVVQVNHPRDVNARRTPISGFQAYFDRAALTFDLATGTFFGDRTEQPVTNELLRIALDEPMWSDNFDTMELYNGFHIAESAAEGQRVDLRLNLVMRDWFNLLSMGKVVTALGNSDAHGYANDPVEAPFNWIRVADDTRPGAVTQREILDAMKVTRDIVVSNGPFAMLHVDGAAAPSMGKLIPNTTGKVNLTVKVQVPAWMPVDEVKIYSNNRYRIPPPDPEPDPMSPRRVVKLSTAPTNGEALLQRVVVAPGAERLEATVEITDFELPDPGKDAWIVAEVRGSKGVYPYIVRGVSGATPLADLMSPTFSGGAFPLAVTNPAFIDRNGNGRYDAPLRP